MECKFLKHGIALSYDHVVKPCCEWTYDNEWSEKNHLTKVDIVSWHRSKSIQQNYDKLATDQWPSHCVSCEKLESQGRQDSTRGNGNQAYQHYTDDAITLEIRPGSTCNFACQTCWPAASSRVAQYHHKAGFINVQDINSKSITDFDFLLPIKTRIKDVVLLGGEPFYDKSCRSFLTWAIKNLTSRIVMFTNGSQIDFDIIENYQNPLCVVVSIDAIGKPAEYIRFGTDWPMVLSNYERLKNYSHVERRVNITTSIYNYYHLSDLIDMLINDWPDCVTFGKPRQDWLNEFSLPVEHRSEIIDRLSLTIGKLQKTQIEHGQRHNAINALQSIIDNLSQRTPWDQSCTEKLIGFIKKMDTVKGIDVKQYCDFLSKIIE
jgi:hypothetical protein